ncbi:PilN domain-containing protein [Cyanobium sp. CH-040]|uniref:PilN domain-containing protein n=1 Tax=Cyanobium sp. CH-040 TaxID=2823708 RepID=UPI0020CD8300|nr:PilN domain-containing protein [Cyanobium sp. CH-040]MCP9928320.1 PilN domain-containing protein [Cyanobium sp. CH-040]
MSTTTGTTPFDLLWEKRQELGLPEPREAAAQTRETLLKGTIIGAALLGLTLGVAALLGLRSAMVSAQLDRISTLEAEVEQFESRLQTERARLNQLNMANQELVKGLVSSRSGSALMRDIQLRVPQGVQLTDASEAGGGITMKGVARDPQAFERINALQLDLRRSPLVDPNAVRLVKGSRQAPASGSGTQVSAADAVDFELQVGFRPAIPPAAEKVILEELGSDGLARRLALLQQEGLLQ